MRAVWIAGLLAACGNSGPDVRWSVPIEAQTGAGVERVVDVALNKDSAISAGDFVGTVHFANGALTSQGLQDSFVVGHARDDGTLRWITTIGADGDASSLTALAARPGGGAVIVGQVAGTSGTIDLGTGPLALQGETDVFVVAYDGEGAPVWSRLFGDGDYQFAGAVSISGNSVFVGGFTTTPFDAGGDVGQVAGASAFVLELSVVDGSAIGIHSFSEAVVRAIDVSSDRANMIVTGSFTGSVDLGVATFMTALSPSRNTPNRDGYIVRLGERTWAAQEGVSIFSDWYGGVATIGDAAMVISSGCTSYSDSSCPGALNLFGAIGKRTTVPTDANPEDVATDGDTFVVVHPDEVTAYSVDADAKWSVDLTPPIPNATATVVAAEGHGILVGGNNGYWASPPSDSTSRGFVTMLGE